jgi:acyl carrier protein
MTKLYQSLAEILIVDEVHPDQELQGFEEWDSLAALSLVVSIRANFGVVITTENLRRTVTVGDLEQLVRSKQSRANQAE